MKKPSVGLLFVASILGTAAYFRSWWLVMIAFFLFVVEFTAQEFSDVKERLVRIETKLGTTNK